MVQNKSGRAGPRSIAGLVALFAATCIVPAAQASPSETCNSSAGILANPGPTGSLIPYNPQTQSNEGTTSCSASSVQTGNGNQQTGFVGDQPATWTYGATATANVSGALGEWHGSASASASTTPEQYIDAESLDVANNQQTVSAIASGSLSWSDSLVFSGAAQIQFSLTAMLDATAEASGSCVYNDGNVGLDVFAGGEPSGPYGQIFASVDPCAGGQSSQSTTLTVSNGQRVDISGSFGVSASATAGTIYFVNGQVAEPYVSTGSAQADAANTGYLFIDVLTPDASYVSDGGVTYLTGLPTNGPTPSGVPEPATVAFFGAGLAGLLSNYRRRSQGGPADRST